MPDWACFTLAGLALLYAAFILALAVAGQLDDAIVVGLVLRSVLRAAGDAPIRRHWPGPEPGLRLIMRLAGTAGTGR
jgi:hypothetical protein